MTDLPPIEYLELAGKELGYLPNSTVAIKHARALHELAQARAEIAALKPRETLEEVARREACRRYPLAEDYQPGFCTGFLRGVQMQKEGVLPDE